MREEMQCLFYIFFLFSSLLPLPTFTPNHPCGSIFQRETAWWGASVGGVKALGSTCVHAYVHTCEYNLQGPFIFAHMHISKDWPLGIGHPLWELIPGGYWSLSLSSHWPPEVLHLGMGWSTFTFNKYQECDCGVVPILSGERLNLTDSVRVHSESWTKF